EEKETAGLFNRSDGAMESEAANGVRGVVGSPSHPHPQRSGPSGKPRVRDGCSKSAGDIEAVVGLIPSKTNFSGLWWRWSHQLPDGIEDDFELGIVFLFQRVESFGKFFVGRQELAQPNKSTHDLNIYADRPLAIQYA